MLMAHPSNLQRVINLKILVIAAFGQVGFQLRRSLASLGEVIATERTQLDLVNNSDIRRVIYEIMPDIIVNAAAFTAVDKAEKETEKALKVNATAPGILAELALELDIPLIHYSTDYVFDGSKKTPWLETDQTNPLNYYGQTKLEGEQAITQTQCKHLTFRTSWVYDRRGHNFVNTMLRLAQQRDEVSVVDDQFGAPTWARHIADVTAQIIAQSIQNAQFWQQHSGIYHLSAAGKTSWKEFADAIFEFARLDGLKVPVVNAISTEAYPTLAKRLTYSCLDNAKLKQDFGLQLPDWRQSLQWVMRSEARPH